MRGLILSFLCTGFVCGHLAAQGPLASPVPPAVRGQFTQPPVAVGFKEALTGADLSLMLRTGVSSQEILQEIQLRGLVQAITGQEAEKLREQGASAPLLAAVQMPRYILTETDQGHYRQRQAQKSDQRRLGPASPMPARRGNSVVPELGGAKVEASFTEVEIPLDQMTNVGVNGGNIRVAVHDHGNDSITVKMSSPYNRPMSFQKANGMDARNNNLTLIYTSGPARVYYVNTPRARMNMCILRIEPKQ